MSGERVTDPIEVGFTFVDTEDGFHIDFQGHKRVDGVGGKDRFIAEPMHVDVNWVGATGVCVNEVATESRPLFADFSIVQEARVAREITQEMARHYVSSKGELHYSHISNAAAMRFGKYVGKRIVTRLRARADAVDARAVALDKRIYNVLGYVPRYIIGKIDPDANPYFHGDIMRSNAACAAVVALCRNAWYRQHRDHPYETPLPDILARIESEGWMWMFSDTGAAYTSLTRTLANMPRSSVQDAFNLTNIHLTRPVTDWIELMGVTHYARTQAHRDLLLRSHRSHYITAWRKHCDSNHVKMDMRKRQQLVDAIGFVLDAPRPSDKITVAGQYDVSAQWHRDERALARQREIERIEEKNAIQKKMRAVVLPDPLIPLPDVAGLRLLRTYDEYSQEGVEMDHCVGVYHFAQAVRGALNVLHYDAPNGERATASIRSSGVIEQCYGPHNRRNSASERLERIAKKWLRSADEQGGGKGNALFPAVDHNIPAGMYDIPF